MGGMLHANENAVAFEGERRQYRAMLDIQATFKQCQTPSRRAARTQGHTLKWRRARLHHAPSTVEFLPVGRSGSLGPSNSPRRFLEISRTRPRILETLEIP